MLAYYESFVTIPFYLGGNVDYESGPFIVMIPAGETRVSFSITIVSDSLFEQNEQFSVTIDSPSLPNRTFVEPGCMLVVKILNDDGELSITFQSVYVRR